MLPFSVPEDEDSLGLKSILSLNEVLNGILSVVSDLSPHVVDEEWLCEIVFIVGEGHGLEVTGHHVIGLNIAKLVAAGCGVAVSVEELGNGGVVLEEVTSSITRGWSGGSSQSSTLVVARFES